MRSLLSSPAAGKMVGSGAGLPLGPATSFRLLGLLTGLKAVFADVSLSTAAVGSGLNIEGSLVASMGGAVGLLLLPCWLMSGLLPTGCQPAEFTPGLLYVLALLMELAALFLVWFAPTTGGETLSTPLLPLLRRRGVEGPEPELGPLRISLKKEDKVRIKLTAVP